MPMDHDGPMSVNAPLAHDDPMSVNAPLAHDDPMTVNARRGPVIWWAMVLGGAAAALLFAWLGRLAGVPLATLLAIGAGGVALAWLIVLVTVPWNLYFAARQVVADM